MESSMPKFLTLFLVTLVCFALLAPVADAKRMGGGKSFGMQRDNIGQSAAPRAPSQAQTPAAGGGAPVTAAVTQARPAWFDEQNFLRTAKSHFIRLQAASDKGDLADIREYTTPEVFAEVAVQLQERNGAASNTEVLTLNAQLLDFLSEGDHYVTSVRFYGTIREDGAATESFDEIWHLQRAVAGDNNWYIAGLQQTPVGVAGQLNS